MKHLNRLLPPILASAGLTLLVSFALRAAPAVLDELLIVTGTPSSWRVNADGTVYIRLEPAGGEPESVLWFRTPANRTDATRFEGLVLDVLLFTEQAENDVELTIFAERDNDRDGKQWKSAYSIQSIARP